MNINIIFCQSRRVGLIPKRVDSVVGILKRLESFGIVWNVFEGHFLLLDWLVPDFFFGKNHSFINEDIKGWHIGLRSLVLDWNTWYILLHHLVQSWKAFTWVALECNTSPCDFGTSIYCGTISVTMNHRNLMRLDSKPSDALLYESKPKRIVYYTSYFTS